MGTVLRQKSRFLPRDNCTGHCSSPAPLQENKISPIYFKSCQRERRGDITYCRPSWLRWHFIGFPPLCHFLPAHRGDREGELGEEGTFGGVSSLCFFFVAAWAWVAACAIHIHTKHRPCPVSWAASTASPRRRVKVKGPSSMSGGMVLVAMALRRENC